MAETAICKIWSLDLQIHLIRVLDDETVVGEVRKCGEMYPKHDRGKGVAMSDNDSDVVFVVSERFERRLSEESGALRLDLSNEIARTRADLTAHIEVVRGDLKTELASLRVDVATESGRIRTQMADGLGTLRAEVAQGNGALRAEVSDCIGALRAEMIDRNTSLLRWGLMFGVTQTAAMAGIVSLLR